MNMTEIPRITAGEVKGKLDREDAVLVVDVRSREAYDQSHIKGALSLPGKEAAARFRELPPGRSIVCY